MAIKFNPQKLNNNAKASFDIFAQKEKRRYKFISFFK